MAWKVELKDSVVDDLRWFGRKDGRKLLDAAVEFLEDDPQAENRNMKSLRKNPVAERELRLFGKYRVLFNVEAGNELVIMIMVVGEKRGNALLVQGKEFTSHHEDNPAE